MRAVAVLVVAAALLAGAASLAGAAPASHPAASVSLQSASWSPNGKQIAFGYVTRYVTDPFGSHPSGFRIVRRSTRPGGAVRRVLDEKGILGETQWVSRDRILLHIADSGLQVVGVRGGKPERVVLPDCRPVDFCVPGASILSPNRKIVAVETCSGCGDPHTNTDGIELLKFTTGRPVVLSNPITTEEQQGGFDDEIDAFSPDGSQLVFRRTGSDGSALMAFRFGSDGPVLLAQSGIPGASLVPSDATQVQWSPNGRWVAYVENKGLEVVPTAGGTAPRILAAPCAFSWSPTSKLIACVRSGLVTLRPDGTHRTDLLKGRHLLLGSFPQWSPDGSRLLFVAGPYDYLYHVWTVRPNGRDLIRLG